MKTTPASVAPMHARATVNTTKKPGRYSTRCGLVVRLTDVTAWESDVTCPYCYQSKGTPE